MSDVASGKTLKWFRPDVSPFRLTGFPWFGQDRVYRRLPRDPAGRYREPVNALADNTAGGQVHFRTDSEILAVRVELHAPHSMDHMPSTGQCGVDCYVGEPGTVKYCSSARFAHDAVAYESALFQDWDVELRSVTLNFPLYQGVRALEIGLTPTARIEAPPPFVRPGKVVFYGTSITQGGCASRPGMAYTNLLSRWLNVETVNLGFSGNGKGEPELAETIASIPDPIMFVLDYEANAGETGLRETLKPFIAALRAVSANVPILVVSRPVPARILFSRDAREAVQAGRDFQVDTVNELRRAGDRNLHFFDGADLLGVDFEECMVDGVHPTDFGFYRMAKSLEPTLRRLLAR